MGLYADWPVIELVPLSSHSSLSLFPKDASDHVVELLLRKFAENVCDARSASSTIDKIDSDERLSWIMELALYALTLSYSKNNEYESLNAASRIYHTWIAALAKKKTENLPSPLRRNQTKYFCKLLDEIKFIFVRRNNRVGTKQLYQQSSDEVSICSIRQATEIENVMDAVMKVWPTDELGRGAAVNCDMCSKTLEFLLSVCDITLSGQTSADDISSLVASKLSKSLFDSFLCAARLEIIPSPLYWKTLSVLSRRCLHHISLIENWARKVTGLTVLLVNRLYDEGYCPIENTDEQVKAFDNANEEINENCQYSLLHVCWFQFMHLFGNPAAFVSFDPRIADALPINPLDAFIKTGGAVDSEGNPLLTKFDEDLTEYTMSNLRRCFFMMCATIEKLVNIFYGDPNISIKFNESELLMKRWSDLNNVMYDELAKHKRIPSSSICVTADNGTLTNAQMSSTIVSGGGMKNSLGISSIPHASKSKATSERSLAVNATTSAASRASSHIDENLPEIPRPNSGQYIWHYLQSNKAHKPHIGNRRPKIVRMLEIFMDWVVQSTFARSFRLSAATDATSERSMSSVGADEFALTDIVPNSGTESGSVSAGESAVSRRSFAQSVESSGDVCSALSHSYEWLEVDGVSAGRACALGTLCRIICSKSSRETVPDSYLAQFYKVVHETSLEKDRLMLCTLIYYGCNIFRLGLKAVEILLPQFIVAIETVYTESVKLRLHPSIDETEMRRSCLQALSSLVSWPTAFGSMIIGDPLKSFNSANFANLNDCSVSFIQLRSRIHRLLIFAMRNEEDSFNLHLIFAMCSILCEESCNYDLTELHSNWMETPGRKRDEEVSQAYCVSLLRSVVSALCDNICKPHWSSELSVCLAAFDCLEMLSTMHSSMLFHKGDLSTGFLVVTSLCRFIDWQLSKPPPSHSRDLHSSIVAAYKVLAVWLCAEPLMLETESCLSTVSETIELGLTGGRNLPPSERKAASKRVEDAAEYLLYTIFTSLSDVKFDDIMDERRLLHKFGGTAIDISKFRHFLVRQQTLVSIHEARNLQQSSKDNPSLFLVLRSPNHQAYTLFAQLSARPADNEGSKCIEKENDIIQNGVKDMDINENSARYFQIPPEFDTPHCKLDSMIPPLQSSPETDHVIAELTDIRSRLSRGESSLRTTDDRNIWHREPFAEALSRLAQPIEPPAKCNAGRVLLYDLGLLSDEMHKKGEILMLDTSNNDQFYKDIHNMVDRTPSKLLQTVRLFYVRDGQRTAIDILENAKNLQSTCNRFCALLSELGEGVEVESHPHWTGHWSTAFSANRKPKTVDEQVDHYIIDGHSHCLWWNNPMIEIAFTTPTDRCRSLQPTEGASLTVSADELSDQEHISSRVTRRYDFGDGAVSVSSSDEKSMGCMSSGSGQSNAGSKTKAWSNRSSSDNLKRGSFEKSSFVKRSPDQRIFVVWLERIEDMDHFPNEAMFAFTSDGSVSVSKGDNNPNLVTIFLTQCECQLVEVHIIGDWTKCGPPSPLVDGCVVTNSGLPSLLRQTVISIAQRRTVELENYQMVSSRRRLAIQEFATKYALKQTACDLIEAVLDDI